MAQVDIEVNGRSYAVACDDGQETQVERLGRFLDSKVMALVKGVGQVGETRLLLLAGLTIADELIEAEQRSAEAPETVAPPVAEPSLDEGLITEFLDRLAIRIEQVAATLEQD
jgi:cell division protein ZapA